jgi:tetratricopeptide (TPR) repeat protein
MLGYQERIQGADRVLRIRRIRKAVFAGLLVLTVLLIAARLGGEGASLKPFFLPVNGIIEVSLIMGLVASIIGLYLRYLEIKNAQRDNQRFLMAKSSMTRAVRTAGFAIGVSVALLLAITPAAAASLFSDPPQVVRLAPLGGEVVSFTSPDPLGVTFVTQALVSATTGNINITVMRNNVTLRTASLTGPNRIALDIEPTMWAAYANWSLVFENQDSVQRFVTFVLQKGVIPTLFSTVPFLVFLYAATQVAWWVLLRPIRDRTRQASRKAAGELESGERFYDPSMSATDGAPMETPQSKTPVLASPPPPPPVRPEPPPPPRPATPARAATATLQAPKPAPRPPIREPETADSLVKKAGALVSSGNYGAALAPFEDALRLEPGHVLALQGKATCLLQLNRRPEAFEVYQRIIAKYPKNLEALRAIVRLYAEDRRWRECLEGVENLLRIRANDSAGLEMKGDALTNLGRRPEALAAYEAAAAVDPTNGNLRQKIEEVRVDVPGLLSRALIGSASGNYRQALSLFDDILEVEPSNVNALIGKAVAYRRSGKPQEALNCLDLVLGVQSNNASAILNRGNILLEEGDEEGALEAFDRLTQLYPNDEEAWAAQAEVLVKMGRDDDAQRAFTEALKVSPGNEGIQRRILELAAAKLVESDILQTLLSIKGIGQARAKALFDAGFKTAEDFARATPKSLMAVKGVTRKIAEDLVDHFKAVPAEPAPQ